MQIYSIGSSSSGNSYIIRAGSKNLLLDVGLSAAKIMDGLSKCNVDADAVDAVLITHEHIDHVRSVRAVARQCPNARFYASRGTVEGCDKFRYVSDERLRIVRQGDVIGQDDVRIRCYGLSHDAREPLGYSIVADGEQLTIVTDTGTVTREILSEMKSADVLVMEANHEEDILMYGEYPYSVKMRIKSDIGHLSNVTAACALKKVMDERSGKSPLKVMLAHLSEKNNTPYQARLTIENILRDARYNNNEDYFLCVAAKEGLTAPM